ncbi:Cytochrome P450 71B2 [Striga hermonthica]|uniref:Cytochrome P450 71B2 n=1 Tax=Striga hermonthica TaxID=68872 RepID=A0A9N7RJ70_STRHE|nr:Cytochrome P450 71B2 [Striga hermonthica]
MTNNDIIARAALGKTSSDKAAFISTVTESLKYFSGLHLFDAYPSIKLFRLISPAKRDIERLHRLCDRIIGKIIDERKRAKAKREKKYEDLLDVLLEIQGGGTQDLRLTIENVKSVIAEMFGAGTETTSTVVDWAMVELLRNPTVLKRAQTEVRQGFDINNESSLDDLKYLKLVIKESLRLHPPTPLVPREARSQCKINGYEIPIGTRILINSFAIGRDPTRWVDPEDFKPERFVEKSVDFNGNSFDYIPFGSGRRVCPGITFGLASVELLLAVLLYYFDWALPGEVKAEDLEMGEVYGFTAKRKKDLYVVPLVNRRIAGS